MSGGGTQVVPGNGEKRDLKAVTAELRGAKAVLPIAEVMAEGLTLAKEEAVAAVQGQISSLTAATDGNKTLLEQTKAVATRVDEQSKGLVSAQEALAKTSNEMQAKVEKAETAATSVSSTVSKVEVVSEGKTYKGAEALAKMGQVVSGVETAVQEKVDEKVGEVVSAEVMPAGAAAPQTKSGKDLVQYLVDTAETALRAAGSAPKGVAAAVEASFMEFVVTNLAGIRAALSKNAVEEADVGEFDAEKAQVEKEMAESGVSVGTDAFKEFVVNNLAGIRAAISKAGIVEPTEAEFTAEKAQVESELAGAGSSD